MKHVLQPTPSEQHWGPFLAEPFWTPRGWDEKQKLMVCYVRGLFLNILSSAQTLGTGVILIHVSHSKKTLSTRRIYSFISEIPENRQHDHNVNELPKYLHERNKLSATSASPRKQMQGRVTVELRTRELVNVTRSNPCPLYPKAAPVHELHGRVEAREGRPGLDCSIHLEAPDYLLQLVVGKPLQRGTAHLEQGTRKAVNLYSFATGDNS